jgi:hypothetical protein
MLPRRGCGRVIALGSSMTVSHTLSRRQRPVNSRFRRIRFPRNPGEQVACRSGRLLRIGRVGEKGPFLIWRRIWRRPTVYPLFASPFAPSFGPLLALVGGRSVFIQNRIGSAGPFHVWGLRWRPLRHHAVPDALAFPQTHVARLIEIHLGRSVERAACG